MNNEEVRKTTASITSNDKIQFLLVIQTVAVCMCVCVCALFRI